MTNSDTVIIKHDRFNSFLVDNCKKLGGRWNQDRQYWEFSQFVNLEKVKKLDALFNENLVDIEITAKDTIHLKWEVGIHFFGYRIIERNWKEDFKISDKVSLISGEIISKEFGEGISEISKWSIFKLRISKNVLKQYKNKEKKHPNDSGITEKFDLKILN